MVILSWIILTFSHFLITHTYHAEVIHLNGTRVINDWNNHDIVENSSLNSFKSVVDNYFYDFIFCFIFNVIIISAINFCLTIV